MSAWLCDSSELISGAWLTSAYAGHGVLGADIPSAGEDGPSALYGAVSLPADAAVEIRGLLTRWPVNGTLLIGEDGAFTYSGTSDYFEFRLHADGAASSADIGFGPGISRIILSVGAASTFSGTVTLEDAAVSGAFGTGALFSGAVQLSAITPSGSFRGQVVEGIRAARSSRRALRMDGAGRRPRQTQ